VNNVTELKPEHHAKKLAYCRQLLREYRAKQHNIRLRIEELESEERVMYCRVHSLVRGKTMIVKTVRGEPTDVRGVFAGIYRMAGDGSAWLTVRPLKKDGKPGKRTQTFYNWAVDSVNEV
jgi:hypothetical protein